MTSPAKKGENMRFSAGVVFAVLCAFTIKASATILPPNNLHIYDNVNKIANIDEKLFNQIIDAIVDQWKPLAALHGATLTVDKKWNDGTVNAYAQQNGNVWNVAMFGGLARRPEVTPDGFALVVCHELGHHFGGYFFYGATHWASAEGEADYFAHKLALKKCSVNKLVTT